MKTLVAVLALALVAIAAPANAQGPDPQGINLSATGAGTIPFEGSGEITFTIDAGCADLLPEASPSGTAPVTVSITDAPAWLNATEQTADVELAGCLGTTGRAGGSGLFPISVSASAPAVVTHTVTLQAVLGDATATATASFMVAYQSNYTLTPSAAFPLTVTNKTTTFTVTGVQASNAPSMIMLDDFTASNGALVSGFSQLQYLNDAGQPATQTYTITFTAPTEDWETSTISLKVYGHYNFPDGSAAGDPTDRKTFTWEVVNGGVHDEHGDGGKESPAPVGALLAIGLVGLAALARRRSE